ncbi:NAD/FAD-dependent oxidoreductase [Halobacteriales archaeon SW_12_71_31]|nr:MAG: NAD/FAD-dependent oxidoreductase [Halobacteriales archaeon SW_12_71_31]
MRVGIVGAGAGAAALTHVLDGATEAETVVVEKSGGLCGRAATRRRGPVTYDYGANYLKDDDDRVVDLVTETLDTEGLVDATEPIWTFDGAGDVSEGRPADDHKWTYRAGLTQIAKRLFGRTDATVHRRTRVESVERDGETWRLTDADGDRWGPFDRLVLNPPAPQTAALLRAADWDAPARERLAAAADGVDFAAVWTAVLGYPFALERPYYALVNVDDEHPIGWVAREECKPGHVPDGESVLVVQAGHDWSAARSEADAAEVVPDLIEETAALLDDDRLRDPEWTDHQFWRYALPESGVERGAARAAEEHGLYVVGDWVAGEARLHTALRNGLEVGERLALAGD